MGHNCPSDDLYVLSDFEMEKGPGDHRTSHSPMNLACQPLSGRRLQNSFKVPLCQAGCCAGAAEKRWILDRSGNVQRRTFPTAWPLPSLWQAHRSQRSYLLTEVALLAQQPGHCAVKVVDRGLSNLPHFFPFRWFNGPHTHTHTHRQFGRVCADQGSNDGLWSP